MMWILRSEVSDRTDVADLLPSKSMHVLYNYLEEIIQALNM
jgi:hypothetical protein